MAEFDLAIIGGGINGAGIARDAAGRGLKVLLIEQNDLAAGASSASTKLVDGGLNHLDQCRFSAVREALAEREVLLRLAPHLVQPMRFVLPPLDSDRPAWLIRAGLLFYDYLARRRILPRTKTLDLTHPVCGAPLRRRYTFGFEYSDCWVDDARLVVLNAMDAAMRGATIRTRTRCIRAERAEAWTLVLNSRGRRAVATARAVVNATGPWLATVSETVFRQGRRPPVRLVKGSHIVVKSLFDHDRGYVLPVPDGRVVFALPFDQGLTLVGTTDQDFSGDPLTPVPDMGEIAYLCGIINRYFRDHITPHDVVWAFAGVRALYDDRVPLPEDATRDYTLALDEENGKAPLLTVYGGRISSYRRLAEAAFGKLAQYFAAQPRWTRNVPLPGGEFGHGRMEALIADSRQRWPFLTEGHVRRLVRAYGTRIDLVLGKATAPEDLGAWFGADLTAVEVRYLMRHEWAEVCDDVLWRRSKLGLRIGGEGRELIARFMAAELGADQRK
jgi:glycerol-3-phosphate dehydrogenase